MYLFLFHVNCKSKPIHLVEITSEIFDVFDVCSNIEDTAKDGIEIFDYCDRPGDFCAELYLHA